MPSRKKRKRDRRRAEATAQEPQALGGWGDPAPVNPSDLLLIRQAIREGWPVPPHIRWQITKRMLDLFDSNEADLRMKAALARCVIRMELDNADRELSPDAHLETNWWPTRVKKSDF